MITPDWSNREFLSSAVMNAAAGAVSGSFAQLSSGTILPGLVRPDTLGYTYSGLTLNITAPLPFQVMFGTGVLSAASGTTTGSPTSSYSVSLSGLVPGSGTVSAYVLASYASVMEGAYQVIGPPPGHPDYDPTFAPFTAYATINDSLNFTASTGVADNSSTFEIGRFTLAAGATGVSAINVAFQHLASQINTAATLSASGTVLMSISAHAGKTIIFTNPGTFTLYSAANSPGTSVTVQSQTSGTVTLAASGADLIYGSFAASSGGVTGFSIAQNSSYSFQNDFGKWTQTGSSQNNLGNSASLSTGNTVINPGTGKLEQNTPVSGITGNSITYTAANRGYLIVRSNSGVAMTDTLPASGTQTNGWFSSIYNNDSAASLTVAASGCNLDGVLNGSVILQFQQCTTIVDDVSGNFWIKVFPVNQGAAQYTYINSSKSLSPGGYLIDTTAGSGIVITLENTPSPGDNYTFLDIFGMWGIFPFTVNPNGNTYMGAAGNVTCNVPGEDFTIAWNNTWNTWRQF